MGRFKAVVFDLDGTLLDTLQDLAQSVNQALEAVGLAGHSVDSYRHRVGDGLRMMIRRAVGADHEELVDTVLGKHQAYYGEHYADYTRPYPGVLTMLEELRRAGMKMAVLSNKGDSFTQRIVGELLGQAGFEVVRGHVEGTALKPDPGSALEVAAALGVRPSQAAFLGDSRVDMETAKNAGMYAIGAAWGFRGRTELEQSGADLVVEAPGEVTGWLLADER